MYPSLLNSISTQPPYASDSCRHTVGLSPNAARGAVVMWLVVYQLISADICFGTESAGARLNWNIEPRWVKVSHKIFSRGGDDIDFTQGLPLSLRVPSCLLHRDVSFNPHQHFLSSLFLPFFWSSGRPFCTFSRCTCSTCIVNYNCPLPSLGGLICSLKADSSLLTSYSLFRVPVYL